MIEIKFEKDNLKSYDQIFIDGKVVKMGTNPANITDYNCEIHGKTIALYGEVPVNCEATPICLRCCAEICDHMYPLKEKGMGFFSIIRDGYKKFIGKFL